MRAWQAVRMAVNLPLVPALDRADLLASATAKALEHLAGSGVLDAAAVEVAAIDPDLADTAAFCAEYGVGLEESANCVVLAGKRAGEVVYAACMVLATTRADVNGIARKHLGVRKVSFAPMDEAVGLTGMEYGGITPVGLPGDWPILVDRAVAESPRVVIGSGIRGSKLWLPGAVLAALPNAEVLDGLGRPIEPRPDAAE
jgi:prolyl-tRNA editing enzyme YbaK/EbsC (Cys-tRNA(Pro) deacylase)